MTLAVVGDALLDVDIEGTADRLCPEAPVPVVDVRREWQRPGGAGLAARLAARSVPDVVLITALGADGPGGRLAALLGGEVELVSLPLQGETPRKTRVRAGGQSLARLDHGDGRMASGTLDTRAVSALRKASAILVADYGRGVAAHPEIRRLISKASVPVVWDPHPRGAPPVDGVRLVTPNEPEAVKFAGENGDPAELAVALCQKWDSAVAVTVGSGGAVLAERGHAREFPVPTACRIPASARPDTCGAGDRFASAAAAALHDGAHLGDAVASAVESAARFVAAGAATALSESASGARPEPTAFDVAAHTRRRGGRLVATGGCFDLLHPGHVSLLTQARALGDALVVCVNSDESVRRLKGPGRPILPVADRVRLLTALEPVDAVAVFDGPDPTALLERLAPDVWVKGGDYVGAELPEAKVVPEIVLVPTVEGYSTTRLVETVQTGGS